MRTCPLRGVKGKSMGSRFIVGYAADRIHQITAEITRFIAAAAKYHHNTFPLVKGYHKRIPEPFVRNLPHGELVNHYLNEMNFVSVQFHPLGDLPYLTIDTYTQVTFPSYLLKEFPVMTFPPLHNRCQQIDPFTCKSLINQICDLIISISDHLFTRHPGICIRCPGI